MSGHNGKSHPKGESWGKKGHGIQPNGAPGGCLMIAALMLLLILAAVTS